MPENRSFHVGRRKNWKDCPVLVHAAIEISQSAVRTRVSEFRAEGVDDLIDRFVPVRASQANLDRIAAIVADGADAARSAGAGPIGLVFTPDLRGTRIARLVERRVAPVVSGIRSLEPGAQIACRFMAATAKLGPEELGESIGVAGLGHSSLGIATGRAGEAPRWIGSRPIGLDRVASRARFQDPPTPVQLDVARIASGKSLETMQPPAFETLLVVSDFEPTLTELCGARASVDDLAGALGWVLGRTSDELSAVTGFDRHLARLLPAAITIHQALAETFEATVVAVSPDPAAEAALAELGSTGTARDA